MTVDQAERSAITAGAVTLATGVALVLAPERCGWPTGMRARPEVLRAIGISDLVTAPGLLAARPRWPWMVARASLNVVLAAGAVRYRDELGDRRSWIGVAMFGTLSAVDGLAAATLRSAGR